MGQDIFTHDRSDVRRNEGPLFLHQHGRVFLKELTVLNRHDAQVERTAYSVIEIEMGSNIGSTRRRFLHGRSDFGVGVLGCFKRALVAGDTASHHDFHVRCARVEVRANGRAHLIGAVGDVVYSVPPGAALLRSRLAFEHEIPVTRGLAYHAGGAVNARPFHEPLVDDTPQPVRHAPHVTHGCETIVEPLQRSRCSV